MFRVGKAAVLLATLVATGSLNSAQAGPTDQQIDLSKYRGQVVYIDFWASWCGPCKISFPYMQRMVKYFQHDKFVVIAVNVDHERSKADAFLNQVGNTLPIVYDPEGKISRQYKIREMPSSLLVDKSGNVRYVHQGFFEDKTVQYESHIMELLNEK